MSRMDFDLQEMLKLRSEGWSTVALGRKYQKDHTTVTYHCRKHGIGPGVHIPATDEIRAAEAIVVAKEAIPEVKPPHKYQHIIDEPICRGHTYAEYIEIARARGEKICTPLTERQLMAG